MVFIDSGEASLLFQRGMKQFLFISTEQADSWAITTSRTWFTWLWVVLKALKIPEWAMSRMTLINSILLAFSSSDESLSWGQYVIYWNLLPCARVVFYSKTHCILLVRSISIEHFQTAVEHIFGEPSRIPVCGGDFYLEWVSTGPSFCSAQI